MDVTKAFHLSRAGPGLALQEGLKKAAGETIKAKNPSFVPAAAQVNFRGVRIPWNPAVRGAGDRGGFLPLEPTGRAAPPEAAAWNPGNLSSQGWLAAPKPVGAGPEPSPCSDVTPGTGQRCPLRDAPASPQLHPN